MPESEVFISKWYGRGGNMLILKGNSGKSGVINMLMNQTNSICFMYYDTPCIWNSICVDNREHSLKDFLECISNAITEESINDKHYDFLIIYTNEYEEDLKEILNWLDERRWDIPCRDIIVTCKESKENIDKVMSQITRENGN